MTKQTAAKAREPVDQKTQQIPNLSGPHFGSFGVTFGSFGVTFGALGGSLGPPWGTLGRRPLADISNITRGNSFWDHV